MKRQIEMQETMRVAHHQFISNLEKSLNLLEAELVEASDLRDICTDEWCSVAEDLFDDLHKEVYAISEPRWLAKEDSERLKDLRRRVKTLYSRFLHTKGR